MKKTGKALSLVLSLALVVSSLTTAFASAATRSEVATVALNNDTIALANGGKDSAHLTSSNLVAALTDFKTGELSDHSDVKSALSLKDVVITSGSDKAKLYTKDSDNDGYLDQVEVILKSSSVKAGTITLAARYTGKVSRTNDDDTNVYGTTTFNVKVYDNSTAYITKGTDVSDSGKAPADLDTMARNYGTNNSINGVVETPSTSGSDATAVWTAQDVYESSKTSTVPASTLTYYVVTASGVQNSVTCTTPGHFTITNNAKSDKLATAGKITVRADRWSKANASDTVYKHSEQISAKTAVDNKYIASSTDSMISKYSSRTYIGNVAATAKNKGDYSVVKEITGCAIQLTTSASMSGGRIGDVTTQDPSDAAFTVQDGSVGNIKTKNNVDVEGGSVGNVTIESGKQFTLTNGTVKDIDGKGDAVIKPTDADSKITTGKISAATATIDSGDGVVTTGDIKLVDGGNVTLKGDNLKIGKIDGDYNMCTLILDGFKGTIAAPVNGYTQGLQSEKHLTLNVNNSSNATVTGAASLYEVSIDGDASLTFADKATIGDNGVSGDGTLKFAPNALYTSGDILTSVRLTKPFKVGDIAFTAATGVVDPADFRGVGFTTDKVATSTKVDSFKVSATSFASLVINGSSKIPVGTTETYTASTYPDGTKLPEGESIQWNFSGNEDYLSYAVDAKDPSKVTVKALKADTTFVALNKGTLTACVVDADGNENYDYPEATFDVSIGAKPSAFTVDSFPTTMKAGQQYTVKITSTDGSDPKFTAAGGFAVVNNIKKSGNATFVTFTAKAVGEHGVYVGGNKVAIIKVAGSICDTTTVTKKAGQPYTFKVTSPKAPTFVVAGIGSIKPSKVSGHDYYYMVKATTNKGVHGVYVNGAVIALYTFA